MRAAGEDDGSGVPEWKIGEPEADVRELLAGPHHAVLGVNREAGPPQLSVVWFLWDGGTFRISTTRSRAKYVHLRRDPAASLLIDDPVRKFYLVAYGRARIVEQDHDRLARPLLAKYLGVEAAERVVGTPDRVIVELAPDRIMSGR